MHRMHFNLEPFLHLGHLFSRGNSDNKEWRHNESHVWFSHGRDALWSLARVLRARGVRRVLLPAYICDVAVLPFESLEICFYEVDETLSVDPKVIANELRKGIGLVVIVNYFGFPQPRLSEIQRVCRQQGVPLLLDAAHQLADTAPVAKDANVAACDFVLWCPHKQLPIPDGAVLYCRKDKDRMDIIDQQSPSRPHAKILRTGARLLYEGMFGPWRSGEQEASSVSGQPRGGHAGWGTRVRPCGARISPISNFLLNRIDIKETCRRRRDNYQLLATQLRETRLGRPFYETLAGNTCPYLFPILLDEKVSIRDAVLDGQLPIYFWPRLSSLVTTLRFPKAEMLARRTLVVAVHQDLGTDDMAHLNDALRAMTEQAHGSR